MSRISSIYGLAHSFLLFLHSVCSCDIRIVLKASAHDTSFNVCAMALSSVHPFFLKILRCLFFRLYVEQEFTACYRLVLISLE